VVGQRLGIPGEVHAPKGWRYRVSDSTSRTGTRDISDEASFKARFATKDTSAPTPKSEEITMTGYTDITRAKAESNPKHLFIFTDNTNRTSGSSPIPFTSMYSRRYLTPIIYDKLGDKTVRGHI